MHRIRPGPRRDPLVPSTGTIGTTALRSIVIAGTLLALAACRDAEPPTPPAYLVTVDLGDEVRAIAVAASDDAPDGSEEEAQAAERRLRALGTHALPALLAALEREHAPVRIAVVGLLADLAGTDGTLNDRIARLASGDPDAEVRAAAVVALAGADTPGAAAAIEAALGDRDPTVRIAAAGACPGVCSSDAALAALAAMAVSNVNVGHALAARRVLSEIRTAGPAAAAAERAARTAAEPALAAATNAPGGDPGAASTRVLAALLLADLGDPRGEAVLRAAVAAPPLPALRVHAAYTLGRVGGPESVAVLAALLREPGLAPYGADALRRLDERGVGGARAALDARDGPLPAGPVPPP